MIIKNFLQRQYAPPDAAAGGAVDRGDNFTPTGADAGHRDDSDEMAAEDEAVTDVDLPQPFLAIARLEERLAK